MNGDGRRVGDDSVHLWPINIDECERPMDGGY